MNPSQREAVFAPVAEPLVLVAPPGSGKTFCLIERLRFVLESGVRPDQVLLLTFTNKAAKEMRERAKMGPEVQLTTFHSFCLRLAREHNFVDRRATVWGDPETKKALRTLLAARVQRDDPGADVSAQALAPLLVKAAALLNKPLRELPAGSDERTLVEAYARLKREQGAVDFDDMIGVVCARVGRMSREASPLGRFRVLMVDEWQDTSGTQLELVKLFPTRGITVVGDPHQSIYAFRGAEIGNWQRFAAWLHPRVVRLSTNYRSTSVVSAACQGLIAHNPQPRLGEEEQEVAAVQTVRLERDPVLIVQCTDSATEAAFVCATMRRLQREHGVPLAEMAVLYRSNPRQAVSRAFEKELLAARIPYLVVAGQALYEAKTVKQLLSYLRLLLNPRDEMAFSACAKHQKLSKKAFEPAWRSHRGSRTSSDALSAFAASRAPPEASLAPFREGLLRLARLLAAWRPVVASPVTLADFVRTMLAVEAGFATNEPETAEKLDFLLGQMEEATGATLEEQIISFLEQVALFSPSERGAAPAGGRCVLSTIHQAKGLEWQAVFVVQCLEGVIPSRQSLRRNGNSAGGDEVATDDVEEERRLFFVAMSRAKRFLHLSHPRPAPDGKRSRFLEETVLAMQPGRLAAAKSGVKRTDFSSASTLLRSSSGGTGEALVKQMEWTAEDKEAAEPENPPPAVLKRPKVEASPVPKPPPQQAAAPRDAFAVLMQKKRN